jgi:hypothetical protein
MRMNSFGNTLLLMIAKNLQSISYKLIYTLQAQLPDLVDRLELMIDHLLGDQEDLSSSQMQSTENSLRSEYLMKQIRRASYVFKNTLSEDELFDIMINWLKKQSRPSKELFLEAMTLDLEAFMEMNLLTSTRMPQLLAALNKNRDQLAKAFVERTLDLYLKNRDSNFSSNDWLINFFKVLGKYRVIGVSSALDRQYISISSLKKLEKMEFFETLIWLDNETLRKELIQKYPSLCTSELFKDLEDYKNKLSEACTRAKANQKIQEDKQKAQEALTLAHFSHIAQELKKAKAESQNARASWIRALPHNKQKRIFALSLAEKKYQDVILALQNAAIEQNPKPFISVLASQGRIQSLEECISCAARLGEILKEVSETQNLVVDPSASTALQGREGTGAAAHTAKRKGSVVVGGNANRARLGQHASGAAGSSPSMQGSASRPGNGSSS